MVLNAAITIIALLMLSLLLARPVREHRGWQAMVTPLASIVGSGFLIIAPLLHQVAGVLAPPVMLGVVSIAFALGAVIRYNIRHLEPLLSRRPPPAIAGLERAGDVALLVAYIISVAFYLSLLSAFVLRFIPLEIDKVFSGKVLTSAMLVAIAVQGWRGGLHRLEVMEEYSVSIKLAIIVALLVALAVYFVQHPLLVSQLPGGGHVAGGEDGWLQRLRLIAGTLLVVQGFETSRYLGDTYDRALRCRSMFYAQIVTAVIYVLFVVLMMPLLFANGKVPVSETAIIDLAMQVASVLAPLLLVAAVMSQFSAAIADTLGAGGLGSELSGRRLSSRGAYPAVVALAIALVWLSHVFGIVSLASRAFALYYLVQCVLALLVMKRERGWRQPAFFATALLAVLMALVVLFAQAVESAA